MSTFYIGLAASFHDPALAIVGPDGEVLFAEATERYMQDKRAFNCPPDHLVRVPELIAEHCGRDADLVLAISWSERVLKSAQLAAVEQLNPLSRLLEPLADRFLARMDHHIWPYPDWRTLRATMLSALTQAGINIAGNRELGGEIEIRRYEHHLTHAANACFTGPFERAACAVVDGYGEWQSTSFYLFEGNTFEQLTPSASVLDAQSASLGMFYAQLCALCGFDPIQGEEWKVMGLAPYGQVDPALRKLLGALVRVDGLRLVPGASPAQMRRSLDTLKAMRRPPGSSPLEAANLARTGHEVFCELMAELLSNLHTEAGCDDLTLGGGCALNSSWNGRIVSETPFERVFVPSAPADDGNALGAALLAYHEDHPRRQRPRTVHVPYLGTGIDDQALELLVTYSGLAVRHMPGGEVTRETARLLAKGKIIGWMQGRAEFGPRALGHRSILADPRQPDMKDRINARIKFREEFRPFAPSILHEHGAAYFEDYQESPYMERTLRFRPEMRARVPAVVHEDGTGRLQTVKHEWSPRYHQLISDFYELTGVPIVLNTSFNVMGKPIIHSVQDAVATFMTTGLDVLVIGDHMIEKRAPRRIDESVAGDEPAARARPARIDIDTEVES